MNQLHLISKYRNSLMGFAILWTISFHIFTKFRLYDVPALNIFFWPGFGGVDIFFFLSGFGLYYSSLKNETKLLFYLKRFIRIFPAYIIVCLVDSLLVPDYSIGHFIAKVTTIGYWFNYSYFDWYVPSLVIFYLVFPFYILAFQKHPYRSTIVASFVGLLLTVIYISGRINTGVIMILFFIRIPIFFIGVLAGKLSLDKKIHWPHLKEVSLILTIIGFASFFLFNTSPIFTPYLWKGLLWIPFILITPGLTFVLSYLFENYLYNIRIEAFLSFFGKISFELFLIHVMLFKLINISSSDSIPPYLQLCFALAASLVGAVLLHKICDIIASRILNKQN